MKVDVSKPFEAMNVRFISRCVFIHYSLVRALQYYASSNSLGNIKITPHKGRYADALPNRQSDIVRCCLSSIDTRTKVLTK